MSIKNQIAFIGYSGHSFVCIEAAQKMGCQIKGYYDLQRKEFNPFNIPYLGTEQVILDTLEHSLFVAIGNNTLRRKVFDFHKSNNQVFASIFHPNANISSFAKIDNDAVLISSSAVIQPLAEVKTGVIINTGAIIEHECIIESFAHVAPGAVLAGNVTVGENSFIGANAVIKNGVKIGKNVIIGAGSVILKNVEDGLTVVGNPGKIINNK